MFELIMDLAEMLNQLSLNTLTFPPIDLYKKKRTNQRQKKKKIENVFYSVMLDINPSKEHPERIKNTDKKLYEKVDYDGTEFPVQEKDFNKIGVKNNICIDVFGYENKLVFPTYVSDQKFEDSVNLLLLVDDDKSNYVYIKDFDTFMFQKTKNKNKKWFYRSCLQCFGSERVLIKHKEDYLSINGKQSVKLEEAIIEFKNYSKQIPVTFKICVDFDCNLRGVEGHKGSYTKKYQDYVPCSFAYKVVCIDDRFTKPIVVYRSENAAYGFIKAIFKEYKCCKKVMNKHFNKNLIMSEKEELISKK